jgi:hypothetical protein
LTFRPQIGEKSRTLQEKLTSQGVVERDPVTRTSIVMVPAQSSTGGPLVVNELTQTLAAQLASTTLHKSNRVASAWSLPFLQDPTSYAEGPMLAIESEHPYKHNCNEFTTVAIPGAVAYKITFHEDTKTEAVYDYIKVSHIPLCPMSLSLSLYVCLSVSFSVVLFLTHN